MLYEQCPSGDAARKEAGEEGPWLDVVDVGRVLCFAPLIPNYETDEGTVPFEKRNDWEASHPKGRADKQRQVGSGSQIYYVNTCAQRLGRMDCHHTQLAKDRGVGGEGRPRQLL
eukprot:857056-Rhodomonas_salina.2